MPKEEKIAILTTTKPLRRLRSKVGRVYEAVDPRACMALATQFEVIIVGSTASEELYRRIFAFLTVKAREKFRMYSKSFFDEFARPRGILFHRKESDERDAGWQEILKRNKIRFELSRKLFGEDFRYHIEEFNWRNIEHFITDKSAKVIKEPTDIPDFRPSALG